MIRLLREGNISYVSPAHSEIVLIYKELKANSEIMAF